MKIPILRRGEILLTSLQEDLTDRDIIDLQEDLLDMIGRTGSKGLVIDVTSLESIDSYLSKVLSETAAMVGALGCDVVISGIQPKVALTLLEMGSSIINVKTALDLEQGIDRLLDGLSA
jgi:rsbT antagonist protein RsbS